MLGFLGQGTLLLIPKRLFGRECTFPVSLERPGDQAVIRVDRFVTTAHERRLVAGAFPAQLPLLMKLLTFEFDILDRKSGVKGKSGSVRVTLGGSRTIKKHRHKNRTDLH